jgi:ABC-2 type transport system ATP-binding protein
MNAPVVRVEQLTKLYDGARGVRDLSFSVDLGDVFGYLGPNGAGKTTTIRLLLDLIRPTAGRVELFGVDPRLRGVPARARIGYLPGDLRLYERLTARGILTYFAGLRQMTGLGDAHLLAERLDLDLDRPLHTLSKGNRQKVGLVQAFMHRPELLVLDEPTAGLDPLMQQIFYELVRETTEDGRTVFLSSHVLSEVQHVATRVALIRDARLELVESVDVLRSRASSRVEATFVTPPPHGAFDSLPGIRVVEQVGHVVLFALQGAVDPLVKALARFDVLALDSHEADLEDVFLALYRRPSVQSTQDRNDAA